MNPIILAFEWLSAIVCFTLLVAVPLTINPVSFVSDYPPEIQAEYYRSQKLEQKKKTLTRAMIAKKAVFLLAALFVCAWMAHIAGASTFLQGALLSFSYVVGIAAFDTLILDWLLFPRVKRWRLPGTEHMDREYRQKWFHLKGVLMIAPLGAVFAAAAGAVMMGLF